MKHGRADHNRIQDPAGYIPADEPVFLLRGQDPCAPHAIYCWAEDAERLGVAPEMVKVALDQMHAMEEWQANMAERGTAKQQPDMPDVWDDLGRPLPTVSMMRGRADALRKHRPGTFIVDSSGGIMSHHCNLTLPDGTPAGQMVRRAVLTIEGGQPNKLELELHSPCVIALVGNTQMVLDMEAKLLGVIDRVMELERGGCDVSAITPDLLAMKEALDMATELMRSPRQVLGGKSLRQWCEVFGIEDEQVVVEAAQLNESQPQGVRVFPDGTSWMAIGEGHTGGPHDRVAFGNTPAEAVQHWLEEHAPECLPKQS